MIAFESTPLGELPAIDWESLARARETRLDPALRPALLAHGPGEAGIERLLQGAYCITTGQQPGLLTGPLFTLYKALSAVALARLAEAALGQPVVPVFWVAGDDHDFAEANHCYVLDGPGDLHRLELRQRDPSAPLTPLYREPLGTGIATVLQAADALIPESEFKRESLEWLSRHYRPAADFASAFGGALAELLGQHGLVVFLANHRAAKSVMAPWLGRVLTQAGSLDRALARRAGALEQAGRMVPVPVGDGATPVMLEDSLGRDRLMIREGGFAGRRSNHQWNADDITKLLDREPERFSPNVLLRPVIEAAILPTLAYVGGPGELAYLEQTDPLYQGLGVGMQARIPRWSGRAVEPRIARTLEKYSITADDLGHDGTRIETELARDELPAAARAALESLRKSLAEEYQTLAASAVTVDPTLQKPVESARNAALAGVTDIEKRLVGHLRRRNEVVTTQITRARTSLFPQGQPQERVVSTYSFFARYGPPLVEQALGQVQDWFRSLEPAHRRS